MKTSNLLCFLATTLVLGVAGEMSIFPPLPLGVPKSDNVMCREENQLFVDSLKNYTLWAHEMLDATAKSTTGVLRGSVFNMGHFDQCLSTNAPFQTKYCLATLVAHVPKPKGPKDELSIDFDPYDSIFMRLHKYNDRTQQSRNVINVGWCIPASCTTRDLEKSLGDYLGKVETSFTKQNVTYTAKINEQFCQAAAENKNFDAVDISFCFVTLFLIVAVIFGTAYDYHCSSQVKDEKPAKQTLLSRTIMAFSARQNFHDLNRADDSNPALTILYGMRTFSIFIIIIDHRFGTYVSSALLNFNYVETQYRSSLACILFHGDLFVDSFFLLSGLLVTYGLLNQFSKGRPKPGIVLLFRYVRLTPVYAFVIFYYATVFNYTGNGPLWKVVAGADSKDCRTNWWTNLLYISNYVNPDHMCMTHSWYLPCDFHYFVIAIGLCLLIKKDKKVGLGALTAFTIASMIVPFVITYVNNRPAMLQFYPDFLTGPKTHPDFLLTYSKSHTRATPYFVGMFAGFLYFKLKGVKIHVCWIKSSTIIAVSLIFILISVFGGAVFYNPYHPYNALESSLYAALHRASWAIGSVGLLYIASYGHGSFFLKVLSWGPWIPLSKLVYGAYLIHMSFQLRSAARFNNPRLISYFDVMSLGLSDIVLAFSVALCLYLMIEAPFRRIFKELIMPRRQPTGKIIEEQQTMSRNNNNNNNNEESRL